MIDVIALGELLIDFACIDQDKSGYPVMAAHPGGAPSNYLAAVARFGGKAAILGKVGNDEFGRKLASTLNNQGIDISGLVMAEDVFTTLAFVTLYETGDRRFSFARKPGADTCLSFEELKLSLIDDAKVFHFGSLSLTDEPARTATFRAIEYAKKAGKLISYDPNLRAPLWKSPEDARKMILQGLALADVIKISDNEVDFLFGENPEAGAGHIINEYGASLVFVTCGAEGCLYMNRSFSGRVPGLTGINAIDTTGAGDIFGGSAMWKLLSYGKAPAELTGDELEEIARLAVTVSGLSTTKPGGISSVPSVEEVYSYLNA